MTALRTFFVSTDAGIQRVFDRLAHAIMRLGPEKRHLRLALNISRCFWWCMMTAVGWKWYLDSVLGGAAWIILVVVPQVLTTCRQWHRDVEAARSNAMSAVDNWPAGSLVLAKITDALLLLLPVLQLAGVLPLPSLVVKRLGVQLARQCQLSLVLILVIDLLRSYLVRTSPRPPELRRRVLVPAKETT